MGYTKDAIAGFSWQTLLKILSKVLTIIKLFFLARLLTPTDFGVYSLVQIALGLIESTTQTGINVTVMQSKHSVEYFLNTAWVIAIIRGLGISCLMIVMSIGMSRFYNMEELIFLVSFASLIPFIKGFINPAIVSMQKNLQFSADTAYRFSLILVETVLSILFVWWFGSVYAWIGGSIGAAVFEVAISFIFFELKPRFEYLSSRATLIFQNTKGLGLQSVLTYLTENVDNLLIGKIAGAHWVGLYQSTYTIAHQPNYEVTKSINHSTFPVYVKIKGDLPRLKRAFFKTCLTLMPLLIIASLPLFFFPQLVIQVLFGDQWLPAVPLLKWLVIAGLVQAVSNLIYNVLIAQERYFFINLQLAITFVLLVGGILIFGSRLGMESVAVIIMMSRLIPLPLIMFDVSKALEPKTR